MQPRRSRQQVMRSCHDVQHVNPRSQTRKRILVWPQRLHRRIHTNDMVCTIFSEDGVNRMMLAQVQDEIENNLDRLLMIRGKRCRSVCDLTGETSEFRQAKSHETQVFSSERMRRLLE